MKKHFSIFILILSFCSQAQKSAISENVTIKIHTYIDGNITKGSPMPRLKAESELMKYQRRFEYLLINIPEFHRPDNFKERKKIFDLYPDTTTMKTLYLEKLTNDKKLVEYFGEAKASITNPNLKGKKKYSIDELMKVASKFFYCDQVNSDTTVQSHVCVGINGLKETQWIKDYNLLSAFCFEAIFHDLDRDSSQVEATYISEKRKSCEKYREKVTTLDKYLQDVKLDLFNRMQNNPVLKKELRDYYEANKTNLAFEINLN